MSVANNLERAVNSLRLAILALSLALAIPAVADDAPFLGTDPASVPAKGEIDLQQWVNAGYGSTGQSYSGVESLSELDYALSDRIQLAVTLAYDWSRTRSSGEPAGTTSLIGVQGELIYVVAPVDNSPVGVAFAIDPSFGPNSRGFDFRILLTKYVAHFENVLNINFENAWDKDPSGHWQGSGAIGFNYGLAHALNKHWTIGIEFGNELSFNQLLTATDFKDTSTTMFLGPTVEYDCEAVVVTFGVQTQLPLASGANVVNGYTAGTERWRAGLRFVRAI